MSRYCWSPFPCIYITRPPTTFFPICFFFLLPLFTPCSRLICCVRHRHANSLFHCISLISFTIFPHPSRTGGISSHSIFYYIIVLAETSSLGLPCSFPTLPFLFHYPCVLLPTLTFLFHPPCVLLPTLPFLFH